MYMESTDSENRAASSNYEPYSGNWFPSFARSYDLYEHPPSGHSRPVFHNTYHQQEGAYSQRNEPAFQQDLTNNQAKGLKHYKEKPAQEAQAEAEQPTKDASASLLGDGNFGIIPGGTFYPAKSNFDSEGGFDDYSSFFHNGHGRPSYFYPSNPKPVKPQQQFENFRDFAEINNPPERQYSQYIIVYSNQNGTKIRPEPDQKPNSNPNSRNVQIDSRRPKNILERLALLDNNESEVKLSEAFDINNGDVLEISPEKKLSKSKTKLVNLLPEKKHEARLIQKTKEMREPLLALS
ncbi:hypothetical protein ABEB36_000343 [Hypothenemus hampei]|uniref:Uncharacterized protein n=1 Tax=Hypothenemus hampei TaxID=57062 RepID=A0ABD1FBM2_HYPHA